jgi:hypothetical protein
MRGAPAGVGAALAQAKARAAASGVLRWQLEAALLAGTRPAAELRESIQRLGNVPLQLELHAHALRQPGAPASEAVGEYRSALALLDRIGDSGDAASLHALGAAALERAGDAAGAATARQLARKVGATPGNDAAQPQQAARETTDGH